MSVDDVTTYTKRFPHSGLPQNKRFNYSCPKQLLKKHYRLLEVSGHDLLVFS